MAGKDPEADKPRGPPPSGLPKPEKLPAELQKILDKADKEDSFYDELYEGS
jgi:mitochondrial fission process protein 1